MLNHRRKLLNYGMKKRIANTPKHLFTGLICF